MLKFGQVFQEDLKPIIEIKNNLVNRLIEGYTSLKHHSNKNNYEIYLLTSLDFLFEVNEVIIICFKDGYISSGLHNLRLAQEIVHKLKAIDLEPELIDKSKIEPREVREILKKHDLPDWKDFYSQLSDITHYKKNFHEKIYHVLRSEGEISSDSIMFIEFYLVILLIFNHNTLRILYKHLRKLNEEQYPELVNIYNDLDTLIDEEWIRVNKKYNFFQNRMDD